MADRPFDWQRFPAPVLGLLALQVIALVWDVLDGWPSPSLILSPLLVYGIVRQAGWASVLLWILAVLVLILDALWVISSMSEADTSTRVAYFCGIAYSIVVIGLLTRPVTQIYFRSRDLPRSHPAVETR
jgi:hypothetical protein